MFVWIYMRHYLNLRILYSEFNEFKTVGPYVMDWANGQFKSPLSFVLSTILLAALQGLNLFWLFHILRIAYRITFHNITEDDRSDNDDDEYEAEQKRDRLSVSGGTAAPAASGLKPVSEESEGVKVLLNGSPVASANGNGNGSSTATTGTGKQATKRK